MKYYPSTPQDCARLARYWTDDQSCEVSFLVRSISNGLHFKNAGEGWHTSKSNVLTVPPTVEPPPTNVHGEQFVFLALYACIIGGVNFGTVIEHAQETELSQAMADKIKEMICPPPTVALCLMELKHPGLMQLVCCLTQKLVNAYGPCNVEEVFQKHLNKPLRVTTERDHTALMQALHAGRITLFKHEHAGMVSMPCNTRLACGPVDHVLLLCILLENESHLVSDMMRELETKIYPDQPFWQHVTNLYPHTH